MAKLNRIINTPLCFGTGLLALVGLVGLVGCTQPVEPTKNPVTTTVQPQHFEQYIQATVVPNNTSERQKLLTTLNDSDEQQRLALFVRYTELSNNPKRQLVELDKLLEQVQNRHERNKDDNELTALLGSATCLKTLFFLDNLGKTNLLAKKGSRYLDRAVKNAPNNLGVRLYRGITYAEMPSFMGKARQAIEDFSHIKAGMDSSLPLDYSAMIHYYDAVAQLKNSNKDGALQQLHAVVAQNIAPWSARATQLIKEKG